MVLHLPQLYGSEKLLQNIPSTQVIFDDIIVTGRNETEHLQKSETDHGSSIFVWTTCESIEMRIFQRKSELCRTQD